MQSKSVIQSPPACRFIIRTFTSSLEKMICSQGTETGRSIQWPQHSKWGNNNNREKQQFYYSLLWPSVWVSLHADQSSRPQTACELRGGGRVHVPCLRCLEPAQCCAKPDIRRRGPNLHRVSSKNCPKVLAVQIMQYSQHKTFPLWLIKKGRFVELLS